MLVVGVKASFRKYRAISEYMALVRSVRIAYNTPYCHPAKNRAVLYCMCILRLHYGYESSAICISSTFAMSEKGRNSSSRYSVVVLGYNTWYWGTTRKKMFKIKHVAKSICVNTKKLQLQNICKFYISLSYACCDIAKWTTNSDRKCNYDRGRLQMTYHMAVVSSLKAKQVHFQNIVLFEIHDLKIRIGFVNYKIEKIYSPIVFQTQCNWQDKQQRLRSLTANIVYSRIQSTLARTNTKKTIKKLRNRGSCKIC